MAPLVVAALAFVLGFALISADATSSDPDAGPARPLPGAHDDTTTPFNLVDVPSLIRHTYDGHALRRSRVLERSATTERWAITYRGDGLRLTGTLARPRTPGRHPVVVAMHGWIRTDRYVRGAGLAREEKRLLGDGFAVLHPDYRNFAGSDRETGRPVTHPLGYPADVLNAVVALRRAHVPGVDTSRMALLGRSMGGGVAMQVAVARPSWFDAVVLYSPVASDATAEYDRWVAPDPALRDRVGRAYGTPQTRPGLWQRASVANYLSRITAPVRIHHGTADPICPEAWSVATAGVLQEAGADVRLRTYDGAQHRFDRQWPVFMGRADRFLTAHLG
jgi:dipeptidyl aminopeptidase/acylaminoacyl peptidase